MTQLMDLAVTLSVDDKATPQLDSISTGMIAKGAAVGNLVAAGIQKAVSAVGDFARDSIQAGMDFDSSMSQVAATMGLTTDEIGDLRECAQEMGATTAFSATEAADALNYMALAGYDSETAISMLPNVLNLAAAGAMDLGAASDMVTDSQTALGLSLEETETLVDQMAKTSSKSNTSVSQLGEAILTVGGTAKNLSGGINEMNTVLGLMADNGIKGSESGTHLRNMILSLSAPTDTAAAKLQELGISATDADGNFRPLEDTMQDFNAAFADMTAEEKTQALNTIFNKTDLAAVNALLDTSVDRWGELGAEIEDSAGAAQEMADTQLDNLAGDMTLLQSATEGAQIAISDMLSPSLREMAQTASSGLSDMADKLNSGDIVGGFQSLGSMVGEVATVFLRELPHMVDIGMQMLAGFISGFGNSLPQMVPTLVQCVVGIAQALIQNVPLMISAALDLVMGLAQGLINAIPVLVASIPQLIDSIVNALTTSIPLLIDGAVQLLTAMVDAIPVVIPAIVNALPQIITSIVNGLIQCIPQLIMGAVQLFMAFVQATPQIIAAILPMIPQIIMALIQGIISLGGQILQAFLGIFGELPAVITGPLELIGGVFEGIFNFIWSIVGPIVEAIGSGIQWLGEQFQWLQGPIEAVGGFFGGIADAVGGAWDFITGKSGEASQEVAQDFTEMNTSISSEASSMEASATGAFDGISSSGISSMGSLSSSVGSDWSSMAGAVGSATGSMSTDVSSASSSMQSDMSSAVGTMQNSAYSSFNQMASQTNSSLNQMGSTVTRCMDGAVQSMNNAVDRITNIWWWGIEDMKKNWNNANFGTPHIRLPHFSVSGSFDPMSNPPRVPSFSVSWYKKGAILDGATIFGMMGNKLLGGGEAGKEAVLPVDKLKDYVREGIREEGASSVERNFVFNVNVNNEGEARDAGRTIAESLYSQMQRMELNYA